MEDMQHMLTICEQWAEEFGMSFNAGKSEMMQLAGRISQQRPEVAFAGGVLKWVTEFRYLGVPIFQGRRERIPYQSRSSGRAIIASRRFCVDHTPCLTSSCWSRPQ